MNGSHQQNSVARRRLSRRSVLRGSGLAAAGLAGAALIGCGDDEDAPAGNGGTAVPGTGTAASGGAGGDDRLLRIGLAAPVDFFSPNDCSQGGGCGNWRNMIFPSFYSTDQEYDYFPLITDEAEVNEDATEYVFTIRPEAKYHNGEPVMAQDMAFSIEQSLTAETKYPSKRFLQNIKSTDVIDDATLKITLSEPDALLVRYLPSAVSEGFFDGIIDHGSFGNVGAGPWRFDDAELRDHLRVTRWEEFYGDKPAIKNVEFREIADNNTRTSALLAGELEFVRDLPPNLAEQVAQTQGYKTYSNPTGTTLFIKYNTFMSPFDDVRVRRALYHAVDTESILRNVVKSAGGPTVGFLPPSVVGEDPGIQAYAYDPQKAKDLLAAAGYADGFKTDFLVPIGRYVIGDQVTQAVAQMWQAVGVQVDLQPIDYSEWTTRVTNHEVPLTIQQYSTSFKDGLVSVVGQYTGTEESRSPYSEFASPAELNEIVARGKIELDPAARQEMWQRANQILMEDAASIWIYEQYQITGMVNELNFQPLVAAETCDMRWSSWQA